MPRPLTNLLRRLRVRPWVAAAAVLVLLAAAAACYPLYRGWRADADLGAARDAYRRGDLDRAYEHLARHLDVRPNSAEGHLLLARTARRAGVPDEAAVRLEVVELIQGPSATLDLERAILAVEEGDLTVNWDLFAYARDHPDEAGPVLEALARGYQRNYLLKPMIHCLNELLEREPANVRALLSRGWAHERGLDVERAAADYRRAVEADPADPEPKLRLGHVLLGIEKNAEALPLFEEAHAARPDDPRAGAGLAEALRRAGRPEDARRVLEPLLKSRPRDSALLLAAARVLLDLRDPAGAEAHLRRAAEQSPRDYHVNFTLVRALTLQGKSDEAAAAEAEVKRAGRVLDRMAELTQKLQDRPADPDLRCEVGTLFLETGEAEEGVRWLRSALRSDPAHKRTHRTLAEHYERAGRPTAAAEHRRQGG